MKLADVTVGWNSIQGQQPVFSRETHMHAHTPLCLLGGRSGLMSEVVDGTPSVNETIRTCQEAEGKTPTAVDSCILKLSAIFGCSMFLSHPPHQHVKRYVYREVTAWGRSGMSSIRHQQHRCVPKATHMHGDTFNGRSGLMSKVVARVAPCKEPYVRIWSSFDIIDIDDRAGRGSTEASLVDSILPGGRCMRRV